MISILEDIAYFVTCRAFLAKNLFYLAFFFLQGSLWHFQRAMGFDVGKMLQSWQQGRQEMTSQGVYQVQFQCRPQPNFAIFYDPPFADPEPLSVSPGDVYWYQPPRARSFSFPSLINGVRQTLYEVNYTLRRWIFYEPARGKSTFNRSNLKAGYGSPRPETDFSKFARPLPKVFYEPGKVQA